MKKENLKQNSISKNSKAGVTVKNDVTLKQIAEYVGTSIATVSLVINNSRGCERISKETAKRVIEACEHFDYRPHFFAQGLKRNATMQVALAVPDLFNPFTPPLVQGVKDVMASHGFNTIILDLTGSTNESHADNLINSALSRLLHGGIDGIITHVSWESLGNFVGGRVPVVHIDDEDTLFPGIGFDSEKAGYLITKLFTDLGCKRIAFIGSTQEHYTFRKREEGYKKALSESGLSTDEDLMLKVSGTLDSGITACEWLLGLPELPDAVVVFTDIVAHALHMTLSQKGIKIPEQIGLASIDDTVYSRLMAPPLTSVHIPAYDIGHKAAEMMIQILTGKDPGNVYQLVDIHLNIRESSMIPKR